MKTMTCRQLGGPCDLAHRGAAAVVFDFTIADGKVAGITFRADPALLATVVRREGDAVR